MYILDIIGLQWRDFWGKMDKYNCRLQEGGKDIHATLLRVPSTVKYGHNEYPRPLVMPNIKYLKFKNYEKGERRIYKK